MRTAQLEERGAYKPPRENEPLGNSQRYRGVFFLCFGWRWPEMWPPEVLAGTPTGTPGLVVHHANVGPRRPRHEHHAGAGRDGPDRWTTNEGKITPEPRRASGAMKAGPVTMPWSSPTPEHQLQFTARDLPVATASS